jgi:hypothetical protein
MQRLTSRVNNRQSTYQRKASRFIRNTAVITKLLGNGWLPIRHDSLPVPFVSCEVETDAGKRYVLQIKGRTATDIKLEVAHTIEYDGHFVFPRVIGGQWHGGYFTASYARIVNTTPDEYVLSLVAAKKEIEGVEQI